MTQQQEKVSTIALGTFVPPANGKTGSFRPQDNYGKPLIVVPREYREDFVTRQYPNPKPAVFYDVVDLLADTVIIGVVTGSKAIVDRLRDLIPSDGGEAPRLPVKIVQLTGAAGNTYFSIEPLTQGSQEHALAMAWDSKYPTRIDDERAKKLAADQVAEAQQQNAQQVPQPQGAAAPLAGIGASQPVQTQQVEQAVAAPPMDDDALAKALAALA